MLGNIEVFTQSSIRIKDDARELSTEVKNIIPLKPGIR